MFSKPSNTRGIALASLTAICVMAGIARGEDGGGEDYMIPAAYFAGDNGNYAGSDAVSCKELREAAWFNHEIQRSDGDVARDAPAVDCRPAILAEWTVDAD